MGYLIDVDWAALFRPEMSLLEVLVRGVVVYAALCIFLRIILKRQAGKIALADLLVVSLISGVCRNPLIRDAYSIPDGIAVVVVVLSMSYSLDFLCYYVPRVHGLLHPPPVVLVRDGEIDKENLRRELMTESQLLSQLRHHGLETAAQAAKAILEGSGQLSVIPKSGRGDTVRTRFDPGTDALAQPRDARLKMREDLAWHEEQIRKHQTAVAALKTLVSAEDTAPSARDGS